MTGDAARLHHTVGRYMLFGQVGAGGMAAVHLGRRVGAGGFSRLVAIKRLHPTLASQTDFVRSFLDEARIAARVRHANVVSIDDVVIHGDEVLLVMEYVHGCALSRLESRTSAAGKRISPAVAASIAVDLLHGLHAAHAARDETGRPLGLIHRDVSPQNVLVGTDGVARVLDFGIAKAAGRLQQTEKGVLKGKLPYVAPERLAFDPSSTISVDVYGAAMTIWEMFAGERYHVGPSDERMIANIMLGSYRHLDDPALAPIDAVLERALSRAPADRHSTCAELASAIAEGCPPAARETVSAWVEEVARDELASLARTIEAIEQSAPIDPGSAHVRATYPSDPIATQRSGSSQDVQASVHATEVIQRTRPDDEAKGLPVREDEPTETTRLTQPHRRVPVRGRAFVGAAVVALVVGTAIGAVGLVRYLAVQAHATPAPSVH